MEIECEKTKCYFVVDEWKQRHFTSSNLSVTWMNIFLFSLFFAVHSFAILLHVVDRHISFWQNNVVEYIFTIFLKKTETCVCLRRQNKREHKRMNVSYEYSLMKMWHSSFVVCDCRHKFLSQALRSTALNLIFSVSNKKTKTRTFEGKLCGTWSTMERSDFPRNFLTFCS